MTKAGMQVLNMHLAVGLLVLTKITIRNFKTFDEAEVDLDDVVVFVGPNNSGKSSALQALALWNIGLQTWIEKRRTLTPGERPGITINRRDLLSVPVPSANHLWRNLYVRNVTRGEYGQRTENVRIDIIVDGVTGTENWTCGLEFDYANPESLYCRPLRGSSADEPRGAIPDAAARVRTAFLPPMSGLAATEIELPAGAINVRIGEGRTAEVLRNLCYGVWSSAQANGSKRWDDLCRRLAELFRVHLDPPTLIPERSEIEMSYRTPSGTRLDLSSSGRGLQQTLLDPRLPGDQSRRGLAAR